MLARPRPWKCGDVLPGFAVGMNSAMPGARNRHACLHRDCLAGSPNEGESASHYRQ